MRRMVRTPIGLMFGLMLSVGLWACAGTGTAQSDPEAEHEAVMATAAQGSQALIEAENTPDKAQACDAYRRAQGSLKLAAQAIARLTARLDKQAPGASELSEHLKAMAAENRTALTTAEARIRQNCS